MAFGMGIDCPNVREVIHWGSPPNIEMYLQETGHGGSDGLPTTAILHNVPGVKNIGETIKNYISNPGKFEFKSR